MTNTEILKKAIEKAKKKGFKANLVYDDQLDTWSILDENGGFVIPSINDIIFDREFARYFWGGDEIILELGYTYVKDLKRHKIHCEFNNEPNFIYEYHRLMMLHSENPIKYLEEFL